jgi:hypothetical protein
LKKGGVIVISTPNTDCLFAKIVVSLHKWFNFPLSLLIPPYHLVLFSEGNLKRIIKKFNLEILKTEYYRCSLRHEVSGTGILQNFFKKKSWKNLALAIFVSLSYAIIFCAGVFLKPFLKKDFEMLLFVQKIL